MTPAARVKSWVHYSDNMNHGVSKTISDIGLTVSGVGRSRFMHYAHKVCIVTVKTIG